MTDLAVLGTLLSMVIVMALVLLIMSTLILGRKLYDVEYLRLRKMNGVRSIQAWINVRTHANRILLALVFLTTSLLTLIEVQDLTRIWVARSLSLAVLAAYTISSVWDWYDEGQQLKLNLQQEGRIDEERAEIYDSVTKEKIG